MNLLRSVGHYWHTIRYLKPKQLFGRLVCPIRRKLAPSRIPQVPERLTGQLSAAVSFPQYEPWNTEDAVAQGHFCFLNESRALGQPPDWDPEAPLLWKFYLHYFGYLHLLGKAEQRALCHEWINANTIGSGPGWHPYPTSLRIINWCRANFQDDNILESLYRQAAFLYRTLETHLQGNHLLENARALIYVGNYFGEQGEAPNWLRCGLRIYREQTPEQILDDGGHFERSPMYHALMLEGYLDVLNLLPSDHPDQPWLARTAREMSIFLFSMTHPSGQIALLNDATREIALSTIRLLKYARQILNHEPERRPCFEESGYYIHTSDELYLVIDSGSIGPNYLPAHAHADLFSYELSVGDGKMITDTGVYSYDPGEMRDYVRSTRAHNTVTVDGINQAECWGRFRVARRYSPRNISFQRENTESVFEGEFVGYAQLIGDEIKHRRRIVVDDCEQCITVEDEVTGCGRHAVRSRIHLHPEVRIRRERELIQLQRGQEEICVSVGNSTVRVEKGWYCPEFGDSAERNVIVLEQNGPLPVHLSYSLQY